MKQKTNEKGSVIVEASIYLPLVLCTVMAMIYLALFNMQEYMMMYQAQRVAAVAARETAYPGYVNFGMGEDNEIDFDWGAGNTLDGDLISSYYQTYNRGLGELYREITDWFRGDVRNYESDFAGAARESTLIALGAVSEPTVEIDRGILGTDITVTFTHSIPMPGVLKFLELDDRLEIKSTAYTYSGNPAGFVRNVNLAVDMLSYVFEKLGMEESFNGFKEKAGTIIEKVL